MEAGSFHDLMGEWLGITSEDGLQVERDSLKEVTLDDLRLNERLLHEVFERGAAARYPVNAWADGVGISLADFLARPISDVEQMMSNCLQAAREADSAVDHDVPELGPGDLGEQGRLRLEVAGILEKLTTAGDRAVLAYWAQMDMKRLQKGRSRINAMKPAMNITESEALDPELLASMRAAPPSVAELTGRLGRLAEYELIARKWNRFFCFRQKKLAREVLTPFGLVVSPENAVRGRAFLTGLRGACHAARCAGGADGAPSNRIAG